MRRREHWIARAERVTSGDPRIIGEDEHGDLYIPSKNKLEHWDRRLNLANPTHWDRRLNLANPTHWPYWLRSRLTGRVAWLEAA